MNRTAIPLLLVAGDCLAHPGHGAPLIHNHGSDWANVWFWIVIAALAAVVFWRAGSRTREKCSLGVARNPRNDEGGMMMSLTRATRLAVSGAAFASLLAPSAARATATDEAANQLLAKYSCQACHAADKKLVGPSFKEVAGRYATDAAAATKVAQRIKAGSSGVWGPVPMPPNNVPDSDLKVLVDWILSHK